MNKRMKQWGMLSMTALMAVGMAACGSNDKTGGSKGELRRALRITSP
ncbi:hypothetical protein LJK87_22280 [Paenibacillus sp. P25]|nr:hypothetical protein LJK87_22280 [Paenibacillus sp. P25]